MLDANAVLDNDKTFQEFVNQQELFDLHAKDPAPSTFIGAKHRRIDYIPGTDRIFNGMKRSGTLAYNEGPQSDHRGLYVDVDLTAIFDPNYEQSIYQSSDTRALASGNPEHVEYYLGKMKSYYEHHRMYDHMKEIFDSHLKAGIRIRGEQWPQRRKVCLMSGRKRLVGLRHSGIQHGCGSIGNYGLRRLTTVPTSIATPSNGFFRICNASIPRLLFHVWENVYPGQQS